MPAIAHLTEQVIDLRDPVVDAQINLDLAETDLMIARLDRQPVTVLAPLCTRVLWRIAQLRQATERKRTT